MYFKVQKVLNQIFSKDPTIKTFYQNLGIGNTKPPKLYKYAL